MKDRDTVVRAATAVRRQQEAVLRAAEGARFNDSVLSAVRASMQQQEAVLRAAKGAFLNDSVLSAAKAAMERQDLALRGIKGNLLSNSVLDVAKAAMAQQEQLLSAVKGSLSNSSVLDSTKAALERHQSAATAATAFLQEVQLERRLFQDLQLAGFTPKLDMGVGGIAADLTVPSSTGGPIAIEVKAPASITPALMARWADQLSSYRDSTGGEFLMAVRGLRRSEPSKGIFSDQDVVAEVLRRSPRRQPLGSPVKSRKVDSKPTAKAHPPTIFPAMPFAKEYDDVFTYAIAPAANAAGAVSSRVDRYEFQDEIVSEIKKRIRAARLVIADLSGGRPNVLFELGYAHGRGIKVLHITSDNRKKLPFDVAGWPTHKYVRGSIDTLAPWLKERCVEIFKSAT